MDSVDENTGEVLAIVTRYQGAEDCYGQIIKTETKSGLFKGFGALVLQCAVQLAVLGIVNCVWHKYIDRPVRKRQEISPPSVLNEGWRFGPPTESDASNSCPTTVGSVE